MRILIGFLVGGLAVLLAHQPIVQMLFTMGLAPSRAYNMANMTTAPAIVSSAMVSLGLTGWTVLFNQIFWGGLWGILFAFIHPVLPTRSFLIKGLIFGLLILVVSNWIALPFIRGTLLGQANQAYFAGFVPWRMGVGALIVGGFGLGVGALYRVFRRN
jgi:hypothetical protein